MQFNLIDWPAGGAVGLCGARGLHEDGDDDANDDDDDEAGAHEDNNRNIRRLM